MSQVNPDLKSKTVCVCDLGLFPWLAVVLAKSFGKVLYYMPWQSAFSDRNQKMVGHGLPGVTRVDDWESHIDDVDLWVFPDIGYSERQLMLQDMGKRVWGSRQGDQLELDRLKAKRHMAKQGIHIGKYAVVKGVADLREYLKKHPGVWVKGSVCRKDFESFHSEEYDLIEPMIDRIEHLLGVDADKYEFIVEDDIPDALEFATDIFTVDGKYPSKGVIGQESKNKAYVGCFLPASQWPKQFVQINNLLAPDFQKWMYRNMIAIEARVTKDGKAWVLDPCCRFGSPPSELLQLMYANLAEIIWHGAGGDLIDPIPAGKWGAELLMYSSWAESELQPIKFDDKYIPNIALRYASRSKPGLYHVRPQSDKSCQIGSVHAVGSTMKEAIEKCKAISDEVHGHHIEFYKNSLDDCAAKFAEFPKYKLMP